MSELGLVCSQIRVEYPEFTLSLDLEVKRGEFVTIIGPSGCGKSTTLQLISGLIPCSSGSLFLEGKEISHSAVWERKIGMVFQDYALFPHLNVEQNIAYSLNIQKISSKERKKRVNELLSLIELEGYNKRKVDQLSGGEQQRIALARSLAATPHLLLLDEPLSALDARLRKTLREQIRTIHDKTGITTLYVTHDQEEALSLSDRIVVMKEGKIEQYDTPENIYTTPSNRFVATFMGEGNLLPYQNRGAHLFFRPEQVIVHEKRSLPFPEFLPHYLFEEAQIVETQFKGAHYLLRCLWQENQIIAHSPFLPKEDRITLGVRKDNTIIFD